MRYTKSEILNFIYNIQPWKYYMKKGCYMFYLLLKEKFSIAIAYYDDNHVITKIGNYYYDATGIVEKDKHINVNEYYTHGFMKKHLIYER